MEQQGLIQTQIYIKLIKNGERKFDDYAEDAFKKKIGKKKVSANDIKNSNPQDIKYSIYNLQKIKKIKLSSSSILAVEIMKHNYLNCDDSHISDNHNIGQYKDYQNTLNCNKKMVKYLLKNEENPQNDDFPRKLAQYPLQFKIRDLLASYTQNQFKKIQIQNKDKKECFLNKIDELNNLNKKMDMFKTSLKEYKIQQKTYSELTYFKSKFIDFIISNNLNSQKQVTSETTITKTLSNSFVQLISSELPLFLKPCQQIRNWPVNFIQKEESMMRQAFLTSKINGKVLYKYEKSQTQFKQKMKIMMYELQKLGNMKRLKQTFFGPRKGLNQAHIFKKGYPFDDRKKVGLKPSNQKKFTETMNMKKDLISQKVRLGYQNNLRGLTTNQPYQSPDPLGRLKNQRNKYSSSPETNKYPEIFQRGLKPGYDPVQRAPLAQGFSFQNYEYNQPVFENNLVEYPPKQQFVENEHLMESIRQVSDEESYQGSFAKSRNFQLQGSEHQQKRHRAEAFRKLVKEKSGLQYQKKTSFQSLNGSRVGNQAVLKKTKGFVEPPRSNYHSFGSAKNQPDPLSLAEYTSRPGKGKNQHLGTINPLRQSPQQISHQKLSSFISNKFKSKPAEQSFQQQPQQIKTTKKAPSKDKFYTSMGCRYSVIEHAPHKFYPIKIDSLVIQSPKFIYLQYFVKFVPVKQLLVRFLIDRLKYRINLVKLIVPSLINTNNTKEIKLVKKFLKIISSIGGEVFAIQSEDEILLEEDYNTNKKLINDIMIIKYFFKKWTFGQIIQVKGFQKQYTNQQRQRQQQSKRVQKLRTSRAQDMQRVSRVQDQLLRGSRMQQQQLLSSRAQETLQLFGSRVQEAQLRGSRGDPLRLSRIEDQLRKSRYLGFD